MVAQDFKNYVINKDQHFFTLVRNLTTMIRTALVLIAALLIIPIVAFNFDETLDAHQWQTVKSK